MAREMKDSGVDWIGEIPEYWDIKRGKTILEILERPITEKDGIITCFRDGEVTLRSNRREDGFTMSDKEIGYQGVEVGDLVVHGMDGFAGAIGISDSRGKASPVLNVMDSIQNKRYLMYYLRCAAYCGLFLSLSTGIRVRSCDTNWNKIKNVLFLLPPINEQQRIVSFLDAECNRIDKVIEQTKASIEEYKKLKQSIITQAVTKGIRPDREMKDSGIEWIGEIPKEWGLNTVFQIFIQVNNKNFDLKEDNLLSLSYGKIKRKDIETTEGLLPENFERYNIIEADDIVLRLTDLQNDHKSLRVGIAAERGIITSAYITLRNKSKTMPKYLYYYLHSFDVAKGFYSMGGGVRQSLNWDGLKWIKLAIPPFDEQIEIVTYCDKQTGRLDELIQKKNLFVTELTNCKKALVYEYVTGKKEVPIC